MTETEFKTRLGTYQLLRYPVRKKETLRAWDAADEYVINEVADHAISAQRTIICNDAFGALSLALHQYQPVNWSDSYLSHHAAELNWLNNQLDQKVTCLRSTEIPEDTFDLVVIKVPKNLGFLEYQLIKLKPLLSRNSVVLVAGMAKNMPSSVWKLLEKIVGSTETALTIKKAKLIKVTPDLDLPEVINRFPVKWNLENNNMKLINHANVFSRDQLDIGARFMLQHLPGTQQGDTVIDLGCGNGVLGLVMASANPQIKLKMIDESYMAIESARENLSQLALSHPVDFIIGHGLESVERGSIDLVVCNPPFHQQQSVSSHIALEMFSGSARVLTKTGNLWVVGNRHLNYHQVLKRWFKKVELVASNRKFVILKAYNKP